MEDDSVFKDILMLANDRFLEDYLRGQEDEDAVPEHDRADFTTLVASLSKLENRALLGMRERSEVLDPFAGGVTKTKSEIAASHHYLDSRRRAMDTTRVTCRRGHTLHSEQLARGEESALKCSYCHHRVVDACLASAAPPSYWACEDCDLTVAAVCISCYKQLRSATVQERLRRQGLAGVKDRPQEQTPIFRGSGMYRAGKQEQEATAVVHKTSSSGRRRAMQEPGKSPSRRRGLVEGHDAMAAISNLPQSREKRSVEDLKSAFNTVERKVISLLSESNAEDIVGSNGMEGAMRHLARMAVALDEMSSDGGRDNTNSASSSPRRQHSADAPLDGVGSVRFGDEASSWQSSEAQQQALASTFRQAAEILQALPSEACGKEQILGDTLGRFLAEAFNLDIPNLPSGSDDLRVLAALKTAFQAHGYIVMEDGRFVDASGREVPQTELQELWSQLWLKQTEEAGQAQITGALARALAHITDPQLLDGRVATGQEEEVLLLAKALQAHGLTASEEDGTIVDAAGEVVDEAALHCITRDQRISQAVKGCVGTGGLSQKLADRIEVVLHGLPLAYKKPPALHVIELGFHGQVVAEEDCSSTRRKRQTPSPVKSPSPTKMRNQSPSPTKLSIINSPTPPAGMRMRAFREFRARYEGTAEAAHALERLMKKPEALEDWAGRSLSPFSPVASRSTSRMTNVPPPSSLGWTTPASRGGLRSCTPCSATTSVADALPDYLPVGPLFEETALDMSVSELTKTAIQQTLTMNEEEQIVYWKDRPGGQHTSLTGRQHRHWSSVVEPLPGARKAQFSTKPGRAVQWDSLTTEGLSGTGEGFLQTSELFAKQRQQQAREQEAARLLALRVQKRLPLAKTWQEWSQISTAKHVAD
eukprot:TRINITY_DN15443_c0_g1_i15.p1 TRINITY_DN15443_c0_g1~~TRINITY_DN15443_c0_g1_i15.p1  ORF type:complete len:877 (+),score=168.24 TRINITY_DN15443_c0_g1_i15:353-2983(+)